MNKRRLLLFSVFALLHITTSERNFIDGRCCNHSSRSLFSDTDLFAYQTKRVQRFLPEIQQQNNAEKYSNPNKGDTEITEHSRRRQIGYIKQHTRNNEIRETPERHHLKRILSSPIEEIQRRQNLRERIRERSNGLRNDIRHNRFATIREEHQRNIRMRSVSLNENRINNVPRNRFENINVNRHNHNDRDAHLRVTRDNRNDVKRNLPEPAERNTQRYTNRINMREDLERVVRLERNIRKITSDNTIELNSRFGRTQNLDEELFQYHLLRYINNERRDSRMKLNDNERLSASNNLINRRSVRDTKIPESWTRAINEIATGTRNYKLELRKPIEIERDHNENGRSQSVNRYNLYRFDLNRERENVLRIMSRSSEEISRYRNINARVQFERRNVDTNVRYNKDTNDKEISVERRERINTSPDKNREYINSKQLMEKKGLESRISKDRRSQVSDNRDRSENRSRVRRSHIEPALERANKRTTRRTLQTEKILARDELPRFERIQQSNNGASDRMIRRNREVLRFPPEIRENDNSRQNFRFSKYVRSTENRADVERGEHLLADNRHELNNDRVRDINIERRLENQLKLTTLQDENKVKSRNLGHVMTVRSGIQIARTNIKDEFRPRSRSLSNDRRLIGSNQLIRKTYDERQPSRNIDEERKQIRNTVDERRQIRKAGEDRKQTRITDEERRCTDDERRQTRNTHVERRQTRITNDERRQTRITKDERRQTRIIENDRGLFRKIEERSNMRRIIMVNGRRDSMMQLSENRRSKMTYKIQYENYIFEMKWQYLFYALQFVYICSILMKIPNDNKDNKQKKRFTDWFTPTEYTKID